MRTLIVTLTVAAALAAAPAAASADTIALSVAPDAVDDAGARITEPDARSARLHARSARASARISGQRRVRRGRRARFLIEGHSEPADVLQVQFKPAGNHACAAAPEFGTAGDELGLLSGGDFRVPAWARPARPGRYVLCAWVFDSLLDPQLEAAASYTFRVTGPR